MINRILVWKGKHGDYYFEASTDEELEKSACKIVTQLVKEGWAYDPGELRVTWDTNIVDVTDEEIEEMPEAFRATFRQERDRARNARSRETRFHEQEKLMWERMNTLMRGETPTRTVRTRDDELVEVPVTAWSILQERNGWEHEVYELEMVV